METVPHVKKHEHIASGRISEEIRVALRNVPYVPTDLAPSATYRTAKRILFYAFMIFMFSSSITLYYSEDLMSPRAQHVSEQVAAAIFLLMVLVNFVIETGGWTDKRK